MVSRPPRCRSRAMWRRTWRWVQLVPAPRALLSSQSESALALRADGSQLTRAALLQILQVQRHGLSGNAHVRCKYCMSVSGLSHCRASELTQLPREVPRKSLLVTFLAPPPSLPPHFLHNGRLREVHGGMPLRQGGQVRGTREFTQDSRQRREYASPCAAPASASRRTLSEAHCECAGGVRLVRT